MKSLSLSIVFAALLLVGCSKPASGGDTSTSNVPTPAAPQAATTSAGPSNDQTAVTEFALTDDPESKTPKDTFTPTTAKIYTELQVSGTKEGDKVKTAYVCDNATDPSNGKPLKNVTIDSVTLTLKDSEKGVSASLSKPNKGWPVGDYHVDVYIDDQLKKTGTFKVAAADTAP